MRNGNQTLPGDQSILEENYKVNHVACTGQTFYDANADARSVCGSWRCNGLLWARKPCTHKI